MGKSMMSANTLELVGGYQITDALNLSANATFSQNKIAEFTDYIDDWALEIQLPFDYTDTDLAFSPNVIFGGELSYELLKGNADNDLKISLLGKYVGKQFIDNTSSDFAALDAYGFGDLRFQYTFRSEKLKAVSVNFLIQNITDAKFASNAWIYRFVPGFDPRPDDPSARSEAPAIYNQTGLYTQAERNFLVGLKIRI